MLAAKLDYGLQAIDLGKGCYAVRGDDGYFSFSNGGNLANIGFIATGDGVVVIDTGPSKRYGEALRALIADTVPGAKIREVLITHLHPDHYLGNQAFDDVPIRAGPQTMADIAASGEDFTLNMYRLAGDWMRGTESVLPTSPLIEGVQSIGSHQIEVRRFEGHSGEDVVVFDHSCDVLYAGDLVFNRRAASTPHADLARWKASLESLASLQLGVVVPGHGPIDRNGSALRQTLAYVDWLDRLLTLAVHSGLDLTEAMQLPIPPEFADHALARDAYQRSVTTLFPALEIRYLPELRE